ncbi:tyrosine-type recombinase/integrase [Alsobacter sp. SYSU BS001988]
MSGGPYGRGKAPERACLKVESWPEQDRRLWRAACQDADPFEPESGSRAGYSPASNRKAEKGYGRWLTFLAQTGDLDLGATPVDRITAERTKAYVRHLQGLGNGSNTVLSRLQELSDFAAAVDPAFDRGPLYRLASRVRSGGAPVRDKRAKLVTSTELLGLGLGLITTAAAVGSPIDQAVLFRDGLIIAFLALRPLRRKNLAGLKLGRSLLQTGEGWMVSIPGEETKNGDPIEAPWPEILREPLDQYLAVHRPVLVALKNRRSAPVGDALWVSRHSSPLTQMAIYWQVRERTTEALGSAVNPHLFRDAAATTLAVLDPQRVQSASALLGHRTSATTERFYQQAQSLEAHRHFLDVVDPEGG